MKKRNILLGILGAVACCIVGCGNNSINPEQQINQTLKDRYGQEFSIVSIRRIASSTPFGESYYEAEVKTSQNSVFKAHMYEKSKEVLDNYPSTLYSEELETRAKELLSRFNCIKSSSFSMNYVCMLTDAASINNADDYLKHGQIEVYADIELTADNLEKASEYCYAIGAGLREEGYYYNITYYVTYDTAGTPHRLYDIYSSVTKNLTLDEIMQKLE